MKSQLVVWLVVQLVVWLVGTAFTVRPPESAQVPVGVFGAAAHLP